MVSIAFGAKAPINIVIERGPINRGVAVIRITEASPASTFATAVVVGDDVVFTISRVTACPDLCDR